MTKIKYFLANQNGSDELHRIYARLNDGIAPSKSNPHATGYDIKVNTGYQIIPSEWDKDEERAKKVRQDAFKILNNDLKDLKTSLERLCSYCSRAEKLTLETARNFIKVYREQRNKNKEFIATETWIKEFFAPPPLIVPKSEDKEEITLLEFYDKYIDEKSFDVSSVTIAKMKVNKRMVDEFQSWCYLKGIISKPFKVSDVNLDFKRNFEEFCREMKYSVSTIKRNIKTVKSFCMAARTRGLTVHLQLTDINAKSKKSKLEKTEPKVYLSWAELDIIEATEFKIHLVKLAAHWIIIGSETGARVSDLLRFNSSMIKVIEGQKVLQYTQVKTGKDITVPLSPRALRILDLYNGEFPPKISDQELNENVKFACKLAGITHKVKGVLKQKVKVVVNGKETTVNRNVESVYEKWQLIQSHTGRRSFCSNWDGLAPMSVIISITGHSSENQCRQYIGKNKSETALGITKFFNQQ